MSVKLEDGLTVYAWPVIIGTFGVCVVVTRMDLVGLECVIFRLHPIIIIVII